MSANTTPAVSHVTAAAQAFTSNHGASQPLTALMSVGVSVHVQCLIQRVNKPHSATPHPAGFLNYDPQSGLKCPPVSDIKALLWMPCYGIVESLSEELRGHSSYGMYKEEHSAQLAPGYQLGSQLARARARQPTR